MKFLTIHTPLPSGSWGSLVLLRVMLGILGMQLALASSMHASPTPLAPLRVALPVKLCVPAGEPDPPAPELLTESSDERRTGKRIGGMAPKEAPSEEQKVSPPFSMPSFAGPVAITLLLLFVLMNLLPPSEVQTSSFSYSVSSYSSTTIRTDDGTGEPRYETRSESSFRTNVPGLAERLAQEGKTPTPQPLLFPLFDDGL